MRITHGALLPFNRYIESRRTSPYVVIFGLLEVQLLADSIGAKPENLAFVALTRGPFATTIAVRTGKRTGGNALLELANMATESVKAKPLASPVKTIRGYGG